MRQPEHRADCHRGRIGLLPWIEVALRLIEVDPDKAMAYWGAGSIAR